ncbi:MAG: threonine/serine exporter family protein [Oscillospiraceae bacterium]
MILELFFAFVGTVCFSIIFSVSKKHVLYCGLTGAFGWLVYLISMHFLDSQLISTFISCFALTTMARYLSVIRKAPTTLFLLSGIFVLVPGAGMYYTTFNLFMNRPDEAMYNGDLTAKIALAISFGILCSYILPPQIFGWGKKQEEIPKATK